MNHHTLLNFHTLLHMSSLYKEQSLSQSRAMQSWTSLSEYNLYNISAMVFSLPLICEMCKSMSQCAVTSHILQMQAARIYHLVCWILSSGQLPFPMHDTQFEILDWYYRRGIHPVSPNAACASFVSKCTEVGLQVWSF